jgi:hypothetical protein
MSELRKGEKIPLFSPDDALAEAVKGVLLARAASMEYGVIEGLKSLGWTPPGADSLDAAWAEAEELAGEDQFDLRRRVGHYSFFLVTPEGQFCDSLHYPTPVAALRALIAKLREGSKR